MKIKNIKNKDREKIRVLSHLSLIFIIVIALLSISTGVAQLSQLDENSNSKNLVNLDSIISGAPLGDNLGVESSSENLIRIGLSSSSYIVGEMAVIKVESLINTPLDMVIGNQYSQSIYHYDGKAYPIVYRLPLVQIPGEYFVTVTGYSADKTITKTVKFNVVEKEADLTAILDSYMNEPVLTSVIKTEIADSNLGSEVEVIESESGNEPTEIRGNGNFILRIKAVAKAGVESVENVPQIMQETSADIEIKNIVSAEWENSDMIVVRGVDDSVVKDLEMSGLSVKGGATLEGIESVVKNDYYGTITLDTMGINYNTLIYCDDGANSLNNINNENTAENFANIASDTTLLQYCKIVDLCESENEAERAEELCYVVDSSNEKVKVFVPHFSSVVIALDNSTSNLTIHSPENNVPLSSGENVMLNFTFGEEGYVNYSLDGMPYIEPNRTYSLGESRFTSKLEGNLAFGVLENGQHIIDFMIFDMNNNTKNTTYTFDVDDSDSTILSMQPNMNGLVFNLSNLSLQNLSNYTTITISANEIANTTFVHNFTNSTNASNIKIETLQNSNFYISSQNLTFNISLMPGNNSLIFMMSDLQGNDITYVYNFAVIFDIASLVNNSNSSFGNLTNTTLNLTINSTINITNTSNTTNVTLFTGNCSDGFKNYHDGQNETGIDCGGSCNACVELGILTDKTIYNQTEQVEITVNSRQNSNVTITVVGGAGSYSATSKIFPTYYIFTDTANIATYTINGIMKYFNYTENKTVSFQVVSNQPQNPLSLTINSNRTTINQGETIAFNAEASGNSSKIDFKWEFNGDGIIDNTSQKTTYRFYENGTYTVNVSINSSGWNMSAYRTINVRKVYNLTVHVTENYTGTPIEMASVNLENYNAVTDSSGNAKFTIERDDYNLVVSKLDYNTHYSSFELDSNQVAEVVLGKLDKEAPIVELVTPANNTKITSDSVILKYKVRDENSVNCSLYTNNGGSWWTLGNFSPDVPREQEYGVNITNLENVTNYLWKVSCRDVRGNINSSQTWKFFVNTSAVENALYVSLDQQDIDAEAFTNKISDMINEIEGYDKPEKELADVIKFKRMLEISKSDVLRYNRDLHDLKWRRLNKSELDLETDKILNLLQQAKLDTPIGLKVLETVEFVKYPSKTDVEDMIIADKNLASDKKTRTKISDLADEIMNLQSGVTVTTKARVFEIEYASGKQKKSTAVIKEIKSSKKLEGVMYYEEIPKEIAENVKDIEFLYDHDVIKEDPIVSTLYKENTDYVYIVKGDLDLKKLELSKTVIMPTAVEFTDKGTSFIGLNFITGFAIGDMFKSDFFKTDNTRLMIEIIVIMILLAVYLFYTVEDFSSLPVFSSVFKNKDAQKIENMINEMQTSIGANNYNTAKNSYIEVGIVYKELKPKQKKEYYPKLVEMHNKLDVLYINNLIKTAKDKIRDGKVNEAIEDYIKIREIYKGIAVEYKAQVLTKCNELNQKIVELQNEDE